MKNIFKLILLTIIVGCSSEDSDLKNFENSRLIGVKYVRENNKLVSVDVNELRVTDGSYISTIKSFEPKQAHLDYDFTFSNTENEVFLRESVYENGIGEQFFRVNLDSKKEQILKCDDFNNMIAVGERLFGFDFNFENGIYSKDLVEIDIETGKIKTKIESFKQLDEAPENNRTGVEYMTYSSSTKELIIPRRTSFYAEAIDDLIKININTKEKKVVKTLNYQFIVADNNGKLFAIKDIYSNNDKSMEIVEIDINSGDELQTLATFNNLFRIDSNLFYISETNELFFYSSRLTKIDIDTKKITELNMSDYVDVSVINL